MVAERKAAPVIGNPQINEQIEPRGWSARPAANREQMVVNALYGVNDEMPGLETLLDEEEKIREAAERDKSPRRSS